MMTRDEYEARIAELVDEQRKDSLLLEINIGRVLELQSVVDRLAEMKSFTADFENYGDDYAGAELLAYINYAKQHATK